MSNYTTRMSARIQRRFDALDLEHLEPIRETVFAYACDNASDVRSIDCLQCVLATALAYVDASDDYDWIQGEMQRDAWHEECKMATERL